MRQILKWSRFMLLGAAITLSAAGCAQTDTRASGSTGKQLRAAAAGGAFAGYNWYGPLNSVHAQWTVPTVRRGSQPGKASTWIGAQAPGAPNRSPFIQIGTLEEREPSASLTGGGHDYYRAFWSDTAHHFHPVVLFPVIPGDEITATMTRTGDGWRIELTDLSTNMSKRLSTGQEARGQFNLAEFIQEDPTDGLSHQQYSYPKLTPMRMDHLRVNSIAPAYSALVSTWMSIASGYLAPTPAPNDGFEVKPARLTPAGARYLSIVTPLDKLESKFDEQSDRWNASTSLATRTAQTRRLIGGFVAVDSALAARQWPVTVRALVKQLLRENGYLVGRLRAVAKPTDAALETALVRENPYGSPHETTLRLRRALHVTELPQVG